MQCCPPNRFRPNTRKDRPAGVLLLGIMDDSPPHRWGARHRLRAMRGAVGFTPTCVRSGIHIAIVSANVGFTPTYVGSTPVTRPVQPHARGEHEIVRPLVRYHHAFTPVRMGSTSHPDGYSTTRSVHPPSRRERSDVYLIQKYGGGSPPRVWGARPPRAGALHLVRFTPHTCGAPLLGKASPDLSLEFESQMVVGSAWPSRRWLVCVAEGVNSRARRSAMTRLYATQARGGELPWTYTMPQDAPCSPHMWG